MIWKKYGRYCIDNVLLYYTVKIWWLYHKYCSRKIGSRTMSLAPEIWVVWRPLNCGEKISTICYCFRYTTERVASIIIISYFDLNVWHKKFYFKIVVFVNFLTVFTWQTINENLKNYNFTLFSITKICSFLQENMSYDSPLRHNIQRFWTLRETGPRSNWQLMKS